MTLGPVCARCLGGVIGWGRYGRTLITRNGRAVPSYDGSVVYVHIDEPVDRHPIPCIVARGIPVRHTWDQADDRD